MNDHQKLFYDTNGYLIVPNALSREELANINNVVSSVEAGWRNNLDLPGVRGLNLEQIKCPLEHDDLFLNLLTHKTVFPLIHEILGKDISLIDHDLFITPAQTASHAHWHHDVWVNGVYHPSSTLMVKVFFLLSDVEIQGGETALIPGSHRLPMNYSFPQVADPDDMPGCVRMTYPAGTAYLYNGRVYHAAMNNKSNRARRVLIFNYGHTWMRMRAGYEPSDRVKAKAKSTMLMQLLGMTDPYVMHEE